MIGFLRGQLVHKHPPALMVEVNGVGYELEAPMTTFYTLPDAGQEIALYTHLVVREDAQLLYGFATEEEQRLFRALIKVNGVGAKMALTILSGIESDQFARCIRENDTDTLIKLPGVGKKTAERLIIEMRDKLGQLPDTSRKQDTGEHAPESTRTSVDDAISALIALGYRPQEASKYVHAVSGTNMDSEEIIRQALKNSVK